MLKLPRLLPCAVALLAATMTTQAAASTLASASITSLSFELIDLDPGDGVAASLSWTLPYAVVESVGHFDQVITLLPQPGGSPLWEVSFAQSVTDTYWGDSSFLQVLAAAAGGASTAVGPAQLTTAAGTGMGGTEATSFAYVSGTFVLSANTELRVSGQLSVLASGPGSAGFQGPAGVSLDGGVAFSQSNAYAEVFLEAGSTALMTGGASYAPSTDPASFPVDAYSDSQTTPFSLSFSNTSSSDASGNFYALLQVSAREAVTPVPEPAGWALMLVGLLATAGAARRRYR